MANDAGSYLLAGLTEGVGNYLRKKQEEMDKRTAAQEQFERDKEILGIKMANENLQRQADAALAARKVKGTRILGRGGEQITEYPGGDLGETDIKFLPAPESSKEVDDFLEINKAMTESVKVDPRYDAPVFGGEETTMPVSRAGGKFNPANWFGSWGGATAGEVPITDNSLTLKRLIDKAVSSGDDPEIIDRMITNMAPTIPVEKLGKIAEYGKLAKYAISKGAGKIKSPGGIPREWKEKMQVVESPQEKRALTNKVNASTIKSKYKDLK